MFRRVASMSTLAPPDRATVPAGPGAPSDPPSRSRRGVRLCWLRRWVSPVVILVLWQLLSTAGRDPRAEDRLAAADRWPPPATCRGRHARRGHPRLGAAGRDRLRDRRRRSGVALALVAGLSRLGEDAVDPPMQMLRTLPHFGLIPLFILWMGIGETPKIALIALGVAFPLYLNTFAGIRSIDRKLLEAATTLHLDRPPAASGTSSCPARCPRRWSGCGRASASPGSR